MKKSSPSVRAPAGRKGSAPGPFIEPGTGVAEVGGPGRQDVRQETHRVNVPKQSERPPERSNQRRSRRPV
jgi:hypothetical protein